MSSPFNEPMFAPPTYVAPPPKRNTKVLVIVLAAAGVGLVVIIGAIASLIFLVSSSTKAPQKVSDAFIADFQAGNADDAYALTNAEFQKVTNQQELEKFTAQESPELQGTYKVTGRYLQHSTNNPETAVLVYSVNSSPKTYIKVQVQKQSGTWKIASFRVDDSPPNTLVD